MTSQEDRDQAAMAWVFAHSYKPVGARGNSGDEFIRSPEMTLEWYEHPERREELSRRAAEATAAVTGSLGGQPIVPFPQPTGHLDSPVIPVTFPEVINVTEPLSNQFPTAYAVAIIAIAAAAYYIFHTNGVKH